MPFPFSIRSPRADESVPATPPAPPTGEHQPPAFLPAPFVPPPLPDSFDSPSQAVVPSQMPMDVVESFFNPANSKSSAASPNAVPSPMGLAALAAHQSGWPPAPPVCPGASSVSESASAGEVSAPEVATFMAPKLDFDRPVFEPSSGPFAAGGAALPPVLERPQLPVQPQSPFASPNAASGMAGPFAGPSVIQPVQGMQTIQPAPAFQPPVQKMMPHAPMGEEAAASIQAAPPDEQAEAPNLASREAAELRHEWTRDLEQMRGDLFGAAMGVSALKDRIDLLEIQLQEGQKQTLPDLETRKQELIAWMQDWIEANVERIIENAVTRSLNRLSHRFPVAAAAEPAPFAPSSQPAPERRSLFSQAPHFAPSSHG